MSKRSVYALIDAYVIPQEATVSIDWSTATNDITNEENALLLRAELSLATDMAIATEYATELTYAASYRQDR